jgi:hypothetical protein
MRLFFFGVMVSPLIYGAAYAQEAYQTRIGELGGEVFSSSGKICRTCSGSPLSNEDGAREYIDRLSSGDRFVAQASQRGNLNRPLARRVQAEFLAQSAEWEPAVTIQNPAADYIARLSNGDVFRLESEGR